MCGRNPRNKLNALSADQKKGGGGVQQLLVPCIPGRPLSFGAEVWANPHTCQLPWRRGWGYRTWAQLWHPTFCGDHQSPPESVSTTWQKGLTAQQNACTCRKALQRINGGRLRDLPQLLQTRRVKLLALADTAVEQVLQCHLDLQWELALRLGGGWDGGCA